MQEMFTLKPFQQETGRHWTWSALVSSSLADSGSDEAVRKVPFQLPGSPGERWTSGQRVRSLWEVPDNPDVVLLPAVAVFSWVASFCARLDQNSGQKCDMKAERPIPSCASLPLHRTLPKSLLKDIPPHLSKNEIQRWQRWLQLFCGRWAAWRRSKATKTGKIIPLTGSVDGKIQPGRQLLGSKAHVSKGWFPLAFVVDRMTFLTV